MPYSYQWLFCDSGNKSNNNDAFTIGVAEKPTRNDTWNRGSYSVCGENLQPSNGDRSVIANCSVDIPAGRFVIVQQNARGDGCLSISEMEIYTHG